MTRDDELLREFPTELRGRVEALAPYLRSPDRCTGCQAVDAVIRLAAETARWHDAVWLDKLLGQAEGLARTGLHNHKGTSERSIRTGIHGQLERWAGQPRPVAATDAGWKGGCGGMGYVVSDGHWGMRGWHSDRLDPIGRSKVLVSELRAVAFMLANLKSAPATVLVDSESALNFLWTWQRGDAHLMPEGYSLRARTNGKERTLVRLAAQVAIRTEVTFDHVKSHTGHPLNEAADALAGIARRRVLEQFDAGARASDLVASFLEPWHQPPADL